VQEIILEDSERTKCEIWARVMGYYRPIDCYNKGKQQEFKDRVYFKLETKEETI
jgi:anaerobic ribonucleoside-triphosphate reductase